MKTRPNILFILSDQQRWDTIGAYVPHVCGTPSIDRLASEGCIFRHAFSCQPLCGPARSCLQTGRFASQTGCTTNNIALPSGELTLGRVLRGAGYDAGYVGKWHLASSGTGEHAYHYRPVPREKRGGYDGFWIGADLPEYISNGYGGVLFDENQEAVSWDGYRADAYTDLAVRYLEGRPANQPFFLFLSYVEPHPQPYHARYQGPPPTSRKGIIRDYLRYDAPPDAGDRLPVTQIPKDLIDSPGDWEEGYADYLACCERVDRNVGRLVDYLQHAGILDETLIIYTSDHGNHFHTRHRQNDKCSCHENSIRIPLIVRGPGFTPGKEISKLTSLIDLPPTLLRCAEVPVPDTMMGRPLQDALTSASSSWPESVYIETSSPGIGRVIRTRDWKYAVYADEASQAPGTIPHVYVETHLYDLNKDPHEANNLVMAEAYASVRARLREYLLQWLDRTGQGRPSISEANKALLSDAVNRARER